MRNPLSNAKILGTGWDSRTYTARAVKRGDKAFTMSRSHLKDIAANPSKWIQGGGDGDDSTTSTVFGSLVDCIATEPNRFADRFIVRPNEYPARDNKGVATGEMKPWRANAGWCEEWIANNAGGREVISEATLKEANHAAANIASKLTNCKFQVYIAAEYHDKDTGLVIPVCGLIDAVPEFCTAGYRRVIDIKTTRNADPARWRREVHERWYDAQAAMYLDLLNCASDWERDEFEHVLVENQSPYAVSWGLMSVEFISMGRKKYLGALRLYCQCLKNNEWPGYNDLQKNLFAGRFLIEPDAYMESIPSDGDPDWMTEKKEAA
jgi:hypothetical protein